MLAIQRNVTLKNIKQRVSRWLLDNLIVAQLLRGKNFRFVWNPKGSIPYSQKLVSRVFSYTFSFDAFNPQHSEYPRTICNVYWCCFLISSSSSSSSSSAATAAAAAFLSLGPFLLFNFSSSSSSVCLSFSFTTVHWRSAHTCGTSLTAVREVLDRMECYVHDVLF